MIHFSPCGSPRLVLQSHISKSHSLYLQTPLVYSSSFRLSCFISLIDFCENFFSSLHPQRGQRSAAASRAGFPQRALEETPTGLTCQLLSAVAQAGSWCIHALGCRQSIFSSLLFITHFLLPNAVALTPLFFSVFGAQFSHGKNLKGVVLNGYQTWDVASYDIWNVCLNSERMNHRA